MLPWLQNKLSNIWEKLKDWSGWNTAGSIFIARMEVLTGFLTTVIAGLDYNALLALDFTKGFTKEVLIPAGLLVFKGFISEWTRRFGDPKFA